MRNVASVPLKMEPPINWEKTIENIRSLRQKFPAPVDTLGCSQSHDAKEGLEKTRDQRFQVLVSLMLSSQTKDQITWAAVQKLKENGMGNVEGMLNAKEKDIEDLIYPVGFYRRKAVGLKRVAEILRQEYDGDIPSSIKDLCELPGVGPKMAHLCMNEAWNIVTGIGVDTHVHRISGRLNWVPPAGCKTPEDTRKALESWLPREYWREINLLLVGFGQTICTPTRPKCDQCYNNVICPSSNLLTIKSKKVKKAYKTATKETETKVKVEADALKVPESKIETTKNSVIVKSEPEESETTNTTTSTTTIMPAKTRARVKAELAAAKAGLGWAEPSKASL